MPNLKQFLEQKASWVRKETLKIHALAQETRIASSLSAGEILVALVYGKVLDCDPRRPFWEDRDRLIISKGHGSISFYPILADLGYFDKSELARVCRSGSLLGAIPDPIIPGYETVNGAVGHGLGVACGMALGLRLRKSGSRVFTLLGDGELYEGSVWEAVMFAGEHQMDNLIMILDNNKISMLDYCRNIIDLEPLDAKFRGFRWRVSRVDGHDPVKVLRVLRRLKAEGGGKPKLLIADTIKGKGVPFLETDPLCHVKNVKPEQVDEILARMP